MIDLKKEIETLLKLARYNNPLTDWNSLSSSFIPKCEDTSQNYHS